MKKKWLIGIASCIMVVALSFGLAACGDNGGNGKDDALVAQKAIDTLNIMYSGDNESTPSDYKVVGQVTAEGTQCAVKWTITSDVENYSNYVSVSEEMDNESKYTVHITRTTVDVPYKLNASVTVGSETKTTSFNHKVPLTQNAGIDTVNATLDFTDAKNYTRNSNNQVWQANGLKLENNSTQAADYTNPARFYKNTKISIAFTDTTIGILHLDFHCDSDYTYNGTTKYFATCLETDLAAQFPEAEITHDEATHGEEGHVVGLQLTAAVSVFEFTCTSDQIRLNSIDVEGVKIGDETIIASAKASLELEQNVYFIQDTATLPTEYNGATIAWSIKETTTYASVSGNTLTISSLPTEGTATVTLVATISAGSATPDTKEFPITLKPTPELTGAGTAASPYTAADAHKIAALLEEGDYFSKAGEPVRVQVKGYVIDTGTWKSNSSYSNWDDVYISTSEADDNESDNAIMIYRLTPDSTYLKGETDLAVGAELTVLAYIQNYGGKYELTYIGQTNPTATAYDDSRTQEEKDVSKALAALADTLTVTEAGEIDLTASTVATVTFTWSTENSTYTISGNKLTVSELPATAVTFDATVTATAGEGAAQKEGTKTVKITIQPATSGTEKVLELTPSNFNSTDDGLEKSGVVENTAHSEEFTFNSQGYIKSNTLGTISKIEAEVYGSYDNMKMYAAYTADTAKQVTGTKTTPQSNHQLFTYTFEGGTTEFYFVNDSTYQVHMYWIKIYYVEAEGGDENAAVLTLKSDSFTVLDDAQTSGYAKYKGTHTVDGYQITLADIMPNTYSDSKAYNVIQFKASSGTMTLTGEFTSITLVVASTYTYEKTNFPQIKAGSSVLDHSKVKEEATNEKATSNSTAYPITLFTVSYAVTTTGSQTIEIKKTDAGALNVLSIEFYGEGGSAPAQPTADEKVAAAKTAIEAADYIETSYDRVDNIALPKTESEATFTWSIEDDTKATYVIVEDGILKILALPKTENITVTLTVTISCEGATKSETVKKEITIVADNTNYGTEEAPLTVAQALAIASTQCTALGDFTKQPVYVTGVALSTPKDNGSYCGQLEVCDANDSNSKILIYSITKINKTDSGIAKNDTVIFYGFIVKYDNKSADGLIEFSTYTTTNNTKINVQLLKITRGESTITLGELNGVTISDLTTGAKKTNDTKVIFTLSVPQGTIVTAVKANDEVLVAEEANTYSFVILGDVTITIEIAQPSSLSAGSHELNFDFTTGFGTTYAKDWTNAYAEHNENFGDLITEDVSGTVNFSNANKQTSTLKDRPVIVAKNSTEYITLKLANSNVEITSVEFTLQAWTSNKTFSDIHIEYTVDGTTWTTCSEVKSGSIEKDSVPVITSNAVIPAGVTQVRLSITTTATSNTQIALSSIKLTVNVTAAAAAANLEAPEAILLDGKH